MKIRNRIGRAAKYGAFLLIFSGGAFAAQLKENTADVQQVVNVPGMAITINPGGRGCVGNEIWEPTENGCSDIAYQRNTSRVVRVTPDTSWLNIGAAPNATQVTAEVRTADGKPSKAGIPVSWGTTKGQLSTATTVTNSNGLTYLTISSVEQTRGGAGTITASAKAGGANSPINFSTTARVVSLTPSPASVIADGTTSSQLLATLQYANGNPVGAGEPVTWSTNLGTIFAADSVTNGSSQATARIASSVQGYASPAAHTLGYMTTGVNFTTPSIAPKILSASARNTWFYTCESFLQGTEKGVAATLWFSGENVQTWTITIPWKDYKGRPGSAFIWSGPGTATSWTSPYKKGVELNFEPYAYGWMEGFLLEATSPSGEKTSVHVYDFMTADCYNYSGPSG